MSKTATRKVFGRERKLKEFHVRNGSIVDGFGAVLYDSFCIEDLSDAAKTRLAQLHTSDGELDWEHAAQLLRGEGLL